MGLRYIELGNESCSLCGRPFTDVCQLQKHHADKDRTNDKDWNLIIVCPDCHLHLHSLPLRLISKEEIIRLRQQGLTYTAIARQAGISRQRIHQIFSKRISEK